MHANRREDVDNADTGSIIATLGLKGTFTGDTLCDLSQSILLEAIRFPEPVMSIAIEPKTKADQDRMVEALHKLVDEDPTFKMAFNDETGQTVISGMGELHLEVIVSRLLSEHRVTAQVGKPRVAYKETITTAARAEGRFVRQSGGRGQYGHVCIEIEPLEGGGDFQFVDKVKGGAIPKSFILAAKAGIKEALATGVFAGYPMVDVKATIYDGSFHEVDSSEMAFKMAGSMALKNAVAKARPTVLEPIMKLEAVTPEEFLGDIIGGISAMRGHISAVEPRGETSVIHALVPLAETFGYSTDLRSVSHGRATYSMEFDKYQELPSGKANQFEEAAKK
jgi:elongation factor G